MMTSSSTRDPAATAAPAQPGDARSDVLTCALVDRALAMQRASNTLSALEFLKAKDIDARVIRRVLLEPQRRRIPTLS